MFMYSDLPTLYIISWHYFYLMFHKQDSNLDYGILRHA